MTHLRKRAILAGGVKVAVIAAGAAGAVAWALDGKTTWGASGTATQGSNDAARRADKSGFKLGDRLPDSKARASPTAYKELKWDDEEAPDEAEGEEGSGPAGGASSGRRR